MRLRARATPTNLPPEGVKTIFVDIADSHTKTIDHAGTVVDLEAGATAGPHTHSQAQVANLEADLGTLSSSVAGKAATGHDHDADYDASGSAAAVAAAKADTAHAHAEADVTGLAASLAGKAASAHGHAEADVTNLSSDLGGKAASAHDHSGTYLEPD